MRRIVATLVAVLCFSLAAWAQDEEYPRLEAFTGYTYRGVDANFKGIQPPGGRSNMHGIVQGITLNFGPKLGLEIEVSYHFGSLTVPVQVDPFLPPVPFGLDARWMNFLAGPRVAFRREKLTPFVHALAGASSLDLAVKRVGLLVTSDTDFAVAVGGGTDYNVMEGMALRVFQGDVLLRTGRRMETDVRLQFGVVFQFGGGP